MPNSRGKPAGRASSQTPHRLHNARNKEKKKKTSTESSSHPYIIQSFRAQMLTRNISRGHAIRCLQIESDTRLP